LGCVFALCLFVEQSIVGVIPQPIAEQQHLLDLFTPLMSIIGFADKPGIEVDPTCSSSRMASPSTSWICFAS
jgi:hypothetical protein